MSLSAELTRSIITLSRQQWLADLPVCNKLAYKGWKGKGIAVPCVLKRVLPSL